jgi:hypothetical protein
MTTYPVSSESKVAYLFDGTNWRPISGVASPSADYTWSGDHTFNSSSTVTFETVVKNKAGINNFATASARDSAISSPVTGLVAFVGQDSDGAVINDIQFYDGTRWRSSNDSAILKSPTVSANAYTLLISDAGNSLRITDASTATIFIPENSTTPFKVGQKIEILRYGSGALSIAPLNSNVTLYSKNSNRKVAAQYSGAVLTKVDTNEWLLIGDLTA